jgi:hypothetical protein
MANSIVDFIHGYKVRCIDEIDPPVLVAVVEGTAGTTSYIYKASFVTLVGESLPSETVVVTTGNATLSGFNKIRLSTTNIPESVTYIRFWKYVDEAWVKIADVAQDPGQLYDIGQSTTAATLSVANTSGRRGVIAICPSPGTLNQRMNWMDLQSIIYRKDQKLWDGIHRNGDVIKGCLEVQNRGTLRENSTPYELGDIIYVDSVSQFTYECTTAGTSASSDPGSWPTTVETTKTDGGAVFTCICNWSFTAGEVYLFGIIVDVPAGEIELTGSGNETVGLTVTPLFTTSTQDSVQRAGFDEGIPPLYSNTGPDWLYLEIGWVLDSNGQIKIKEFIDGVPKQVTLATERTALEIELARQRFDTSGDFVVNKFPLQVKEHSTDDSKLILSVGRGKAYPNGFEVQFDGTRLLEFDRARETKTVNNSGIDAFDIPGGRVTCSNDENYDLNGLALKFKVSSGNYHTVTFASDGMTAAQVASFIESEVNSYGAEDVINCVASEDGYLQLQAPNGKTLEIAAVASDAYTILGISTGTNQPIGTRIYSLNDTFVKEVTDISYKIRKVTAVTHNGTTHLDLLGENCVNILGASATVADCNDTKYDYTESIDWQKTGNYIDFTLGGSEPVSGSTFYVDWEQNYSPTKGSRILVEVIDATITKGAEDGLDNIVYTGATSIKKVSNGDNVTLTGNASDVVGILRVNNSAGQSTTQYTSYSFLKNSGALAHDTSQVDWSDAGTQGESGTGQPMTGVAYYISFRLWYHAVEGDLVTADSYDNYEQIMYHHGVALRDCVDFRTTGSTLPEDGEDATIDYSYYLGRIDKLVIDDLANIRLITGAAAPFPDAPSDQSGVQSLAVIRIPPYTYLPSHVITVSLEVLRLTQKQIQNVADRVTKLEYWNAVNDLEKEANNQAIYGSIGGLSIAAEKQGIFTDTLTGFGRCDLRYDKNDVSFSVAIDNISRHLRLAASQDVQIIEVDANNCVNVRYGDNTIMLDYQPEVIESQPYAGITVNGASDYVVTNYYGNMDISPQVDVFVDSTQLPVLNVDFDNNLIPLINALNPVLANNINWGSWSNYPAHSMINAMMTYQANNMDLPQGYSPERMFNIYEDSWPQWVPMFNDPTSEGYNAWGLLSTTRSGTYTQLIPGSISQSIGNRVVDLSLQGMMRSGISISISVTGLLPNADHAVTMGGIPCDLTYDSSPTNFSGGAGSHTYQGKTTVESSNDGTFTATFVTPEGIPVGNTTITVFYYADPIISAASAAYYTTGFSMSNQETIANGIPSVQEDTQVTSESDFYYKSCLGGPDPLAQSFILEESAYISEVHLAFSTKDADKSYTVQIRNMVNGMPGTKIFASKTLAPADIDVSDDSSAYTEFVFDNVLQYMANTEYCFIGLPQGNSTGYNLYAAEVSTVDLISEARINTQTASGVLFHSPNNRTWEPWTKRDLKYKLVKSNFENNCQIYWQNLTGVQASILVLAVEEFLGAGTNAMWSYSLDNGTTWIPFSPGIDTELGEIITQVKLRVDVTSLGGNYQVISRFAGILFLYHNADGWYVGNDEPFTDALNLPNKITIYLDINADGTNGVGVTSVTPYASIDDGETMFELPVKVGYTAVAASVEPFYTYQFETPDEATITGATNTEPIVVASAGHGFTDNMIVTIAGVEGNTNTNGDWRVTNADANSFELYTEAGVASAGNSAYTTGGTVVMKEFDQVREYIYLETTNRALTPKVMNIAFIESRVA